jgi:hypothetical protein
VQEVPVSVGSIIEVRHAEPGRGRLMNTMANRELMRFTTNVQRFVVTPYGLVIDGTTDERMPSW